MVATWSNVPRSAGNGWARSWTIVRTRSLMPFRAALRSAKCRQRRLQLDADDVAVRDARGEAEADRAHAGTEIEDALRRTRHRRRRPAARHRRRHDNRAAAATAARGRPATRLRSGGVSMLANDHRHDIVSQHPAFAGGLSFHAWQPSFPSKASARRPAWSRCCRSAPTTWRRSIARSWRACARRWR